MEHRGAEYNPEMTNPLERKLTNIQQLRGYIVSVPDGKVEQFRKNEDLQLGEFGTFVDVQIVYEDCNP